MWLDTPSKEEQKIIDKYQKYTSRYNVLSIPLKYWDAFDELETIHKSYYELFQNHFDDLKYYALMYRDVELTNHIFMHDMAFFTQKKNEIIGFKKRILADYSLKSQVVQLFYNYEPMFVSFCKEVLDVKNWRRHPGGSSYNYERDYVAIKNGNLRDLRFCIDKLTEEQCKIIIENKKELNNRPVFFNYEPLPTIKTKTEFVENVFIPCFYSETSKWEFSRKHLIDYIKQKFHTEKIEDFIHFKMNEVTKALSLKSLKYFENHIYYEGEDVKKLKENWPEHKSYPSRPSLYFSRPKSRLETSSNSHVGLFENWNDKITKYREQLRPKDPAIYLKETQEYNKKCREIDDEYDKRVKVIQEQIRNLQKEKQANIINEYNCIIRNIEDYLFSSNSIGLYIFNNLEDIKKYLCQVYDSYCKTIWFNNSNDFRAYLICHRHSKNGNLFIKTFLELEKSNKRYINSDEYITFKNKSFERIDVDTWISSVRQHYKEIEEKEKIELEQKAEIERIEHEKRMEKYRFNKRNAHARDKNIELRQSDHIYIVNGIALDSVTTFVNNAFPKFNAEYHAKRKAEQLGISPEEVLDMWERKGKESRDLGTAMHSKIENYYLGNDSDETDAYKLFKIFANKVELKPYRTEWTVYDWEHKIAGTIDFVDYQNGEYIIYDWKRSEKIIENGMPVKINKYGEKGNYPLEHLDNTPYYHYALQLSLYKYILEKNYGMKISDLRLGIFHPSYNKPYVLRMPYLEKEINDIFNLRSDVIF